MGKNVVPGKGSGVKILHCNHGKTVGSRKRFWSENLALQSWEIFWFQERVLEWKSCTAIMGFFWGSRKGFWSENFALQSWENCWFQERVLEWKFCTAIMGKFLVPGKGSGVSMLGKPGQTLKKFIKTFKKTWCTFDALLKVHQNDALLMHFHMIMMHFWCTFKRVSKVHQKCIMIFHPNHIKISKNWGVLPRVSCQPVTAGVPKIDIAQGDKKWQNKITCKSRTLHI